MRDFILGTGTVAAVIATAPAEYVANLVSPTPARKPNPVRAPFKLEERLNESFSKISRLESGWDGPGSVAPARLALAFAQRVASMALDGISDPRLPFVVPVGNGGVQIEWHSNEIELEAYFGPTGGMTALVELIGRGVEIEKSGHEALDLILRWAPRAASRARNASHEADATAASLFRVAA